jgi:purine catabolism regulator
VLTVRSLLEQVGLELAAGEAGADAPVRWVHSTELTDPVPWLSGGELILTTGIQLRDAAEQRAFVRRLAGHGLAGLGFGTGFGHERLPKPVVAEATAQGFPLFEVPYEVPFIAITERAFAQLVNEQYEVLRRSIAVHGALERLVLEERGLAEVVDAVAAATSGPVLVLDPGGQVMTAGTRHGELPEGALDDVRGRLPAAARNGAGGFEVDLGADAGTALVLPVPAPLDRGTPQAWVVAACAPGSGDFERLILQQTVTVVALELMRERIRHDTERRLAGDVLAEALTGRLDPEELEGRLRPFGIGEQAAVLVFALDQPDAAAQRVEALLGDAGVRALVALRGNQVCAVVDGGGIDPVEVAGRVRAELAREHGSVRAAASRPAPAGALRRSFHEARCALEAAAVANGAGPEVASHRDLGAFQLLLALQDDEALRAYCNSLLGPLETGDRQYGEELLRSLQAFIENNGHWERAARELFCHRHTLRYRMRRVEELTGRDLGHARDRIELWLALRGRELLP